MKSYIKYIRLFICFVIAVCLTSVSVPCGAQTEPGPVIDYTDKKSEAIELISDSGDVNFWVKNKALHVESKSSGDGKCEPFVVFDVEIPDASKAQWLKICIKNCSSAPKLRFGFGENEITGASCSLLDISSEDSKYKTYIVNMSTINEETLPLSSMFGICDPSVTESVWQGHINKFRIGLFFTDFPGDDIPENLNAEIAYIGFFETEKAAKSAYVKLPSNQKDRSDILVAGFVIVLVIVLVIAILKYGSGSEGKNTGKKKTTKKTTKNKGRK